MLQNYPVFLKKVELDLVTIQRPTGVELRGLSRIRFRV